MPLDAHGPPLFPDPLARRRAWREMLWNDHGFLRIGFRNLHQISNELWRANQPQPHHLRSMISEIGLKTLVNLRGPSKKGYYLLEKETCQSLGIKLVDFKVFSREVPSPAQILAARDLFNEIEYPAVIHCKSGADRTGIMAALYLILRLQQPVDVAAKQLSIKYLHIRQGKTGVLDYYLEAYLSAQADTGISFLDWATDEAYVQGLKEAFLASRR